MYQMSVLCDLPTTSEGTTSAILIGLAVCGTSSKVGHTGSCITAITFVTAGFLESIVEGSALLLPVACCCYDVNSQLVCFV